MRSREDVGANKPVTSETERFSYANALIAAPPLYSRELCSRVRDFYCSSECSETTCRRCGIHSDVKVTNDSGKSLVESLMKLIKTRPNIQLDRPIIYLAVRLGLHPATRTYHITRSRRNYVKRKCPGFSLFSHWASEQWSFLHNTVEGAVDSNVMGEKEARICRFTQRYTRWWIASRQ